jgi:hypothetical protein
MHRKAKGPLPKMKQQNLALTLALLLAAFVPALVANAQPANATAVQRLQLSAFGGVSGVYTGFQSGKNLSLAAGIDLGLAPHFGVRPVVEVRGVYPVDKGQVDSQKDILGGLKVDFLLHHRVHPYADFLFGRGQMNYGASGFYFGNYIYDITTTYVYSPGAGIDCQFSDHLALKIDAQLQRWAGPTPTASGVVYPKVGTLGLVYIFDFNHHGVVH